MWIFENAGFDSESRHRCSVQKAGYPISRIYARSFGTVKTHAQRRTVFTLRRAAIPYGKRYKIDVLFAVFTCLKNSGRFEARIFYKTDLERKKAARLR